MPDFLRTLPREIALDPHGALVRFNEASKSDVDLGGQNREDVRIHDVAVFSGETSVCVGTLVLHKDGWAAFTEIWVEPEHRGQGIASAVYEAIEDTGVRLEPWDGLDEDTARFWQMRSARSAKP